MAEIRNPAATAMPDEGPLPLLQPRPIPSERAIYWVPTQFGSKGSAAGIVPEGPVLITRDALRALDAHVAASPGEGRLGYLVGERFRDPETRQPYVIVTSVIPVTRPLVADRSVQLVADTVDLVRSEAQHARRYLLGWYHSHPYGQPTLTRADLETHSAHFPEDWTVAIVMTVGRGAPQASVLRPAGDRFRHAPALPFYELMESESLLANSEAKPSVVTWSNYFTDESIKQDRPARISSAFGLSAGMPTRGSGVIPASAFSEPPGRLRRRKIDRWLRPVLLAAFGIVSILALILAIQLAERGGQERTPAPLGAAPRSPTAAAFAISADSVARALRGYRDLAALFDSGRVGCVQLGLGLVRVEDRWITYAMRQRDLGASMAEPLAARHQALDVETQWVERHFGRSGCPRP